ncbi:MAG TPA: NAD(P)-dependent oxidoreductase [Candidatus Hydrogenedentes bacterium]|nr:NAD(P)-dependent oxidoreductase [Candidatus Hydrogenedentota bacterium]HPG65669.1 NAD(P)-dependent oxidoreductase [Candidatus Hydrogenedentota bacterium]
MSARKRDARPNAEQFIFISSICYHGVLEQRGAEFMPRFLPFDETHPALSVNYYGGGKAQAEHRCRMYVRRYGKPVVAFRPAWIVPTDQEDILEPRPAPDHPALLDYVACTDLVDAIARALDYSPPDGFDRFLAHAPDQRSSTPTLELLDTHFRGVPADREKLASHGGFAAFVDCTHAHDALGWQPRLRRPTA